MKNQNVLFCFLFLFILRILFSIAVLRSTPLTSCRRVTSSPLSHQSPLPVSRRSLHPGYQDHQGVPGRCGDICEEPPCHVQPHLPGGETPPGGQDQRRLQVHLGGSGPGGGRRWQLPGALPGHRYAIYLRLLPPACGINKSLYVCQFFFFFGKDVGKYHQFTCR